MNGSDRVAVIISATTVQEGLAQLIISHLSRSDSKTHDELFGVEGPLSTFSNLIRIAYAMGLVTVAMKTDLNSIRRIRNVFAHGLRPLAVSEPEIHLEINRLRLHGQVTAEEQTLFEQMDGKSKFVVCCLSISSECLNRTSARYAKLTRTMTAYLDLMKQRDGK